MKEMRHFMSAAFLTGCSVLTLMLTGCAVEDNLGSQSSIRSNFTTEQIKNAVVGMWLDETTLTANDTERLYDIAPDGQCNLYDLSISNPGDEVENIESMTTYSGTWSVTNETGNLNFLDQFQLNDYELMGSLMFNTEMQIDEDDEALKQLVESGLKLNLEKKDTLAVLCSKGGDVLFVSRYDADLYAMLKETGQLSDQQAAARAATRALTEEQIAQKINKIKASYDLFEVLCQMAGTDVSLVNPTYMSIYYSAVNPRICDMSFLGAAAVPSYYVPESMDPLPTGLKRQYLSVTKLWELGVRYFDLGCFFKPGKDGDTYGFYDPDADYLYPNVTPKDIFQELKGLLDKYKEETAIIKFSVAPDADLFQTITYAEQMSNELKEIFGNRVLSEYGPDIRLNDCRRKLILMNDFPYHMPYMFMGLELGSIWKDYSPSQDLVFPNDSTGHVAVNVLQKVIDAEEKATIVKSTLDYANQSAVNTVPTWVINNVSCYLDGTGKRGFSMMANTLNEVVAKELLSKKYGKTGIMVFDFVGKNGRVNEELGFDPKGSQLIGAVVGVNYHAVLNHLISFEKGDMPAFPDEQ